MKQLRMKSTDITQVNIDKIAKLFPNVITEARDEHGKLQRAIDFDLLKQELSDFLVEGDKERYQLTWPGKKEAIFNANVSIDKTLRPIKEDSVDWETTQNMYIEGDNLDVLKLLQESYLTKVKCIYIDPPYNTGKDFIYKDTFKQPVSEYIEDSGQIDENGNRLVQNLESNGRFHSDWLSMIYSRLKIARNLLSNDGLIMVSIDDNECSNLVKVLDEIFGSDNFITNIVWKHTQQSKNDEPYFSRHHNSILVYRKSDELPKIRVDRTEENNKAYSNPDNDPKGLWRSGDVRSPSLRETLKYNINTPSGKIILPPENGWRWSQTTLHEKILNGEIIFNEDETKIIRKIYLSDQEGRTPENVFLPEDVGTTREATSELKELFDGTSPFDTPKPTKLLKKLISLVPNNKDGIVLDFFPGSATTAHAVLQLNAEDGGSRKFIMVQLPEKADEKTDAYKAGYKNICEIGKERIRRAAKKIKKETGADIDYGFRVYRVDSSNMKDVYYTPDKLGQVDLEDVSSNIKEDRTSEDLLIQVMLECGLELSLPMESRGIQGKTVHYVAGNSLIACFDDDVSESVFKKIAEEQPLRVVFRDSSFKDDSARINVEELFKLLSPSTEIQVV